MLHYSVPVDGGTVGLVYFKLPVAFSLDILQSESKAFLGTFLPTIAMAFKKLKELKSSHNIGVCLPLIDSVCVTLAKRFDYYFEDESCLLA